MVAFVQSTTINKGFTMQVQDILQLDKDHCWHPCTQMKDHEKFSPLVVDRTEGSHIYLSDGTCVIDAISSWWCKSLGHSHPYLKQALLTQLDKFEHVIFANTTHETIAKLSARLAQLIPTLDKVFYAGDGSCAVEIALKMSLHYQALVGQTQRTKFVALRNGYHGETSAALSVSDVGCYRSPYQALLFDPVLIDPPYVSGTTDPLWNDTYSHWETVKETLDKEADNISAIIVEPILQGAGGMNIYSQDFLARLSTYAKQKGIHLIADEIMTGCGRTGKMLACEHAGITPDFVCLSKGLTSGYMPFSTVLTTTPVYQAFYDDYAAGKSFLHSHTYSGHALGASIALATLEVLEAEQLCARAVEMYAQMHQYICAIAEETELLTNIRGIGALVAADLIGDHLPKRVGYLLSREAEKKGVLLRCLGDTLYWCPPLNMPKNVLDDMASITGDVLKDLSAKPHGLSKG